MKQRSTLGLAVVGRRRHIDGDGVVGKDQGARLRPWVATAWPKMARGGPAMRIVAAVGGDSPVRRCDSGLQRGYGFHDLGQKLDERDRELRGNRAMTVTHSSVFMVAALARGPSPYDDGRCS